jgi:phage baseplate assembly protein W
MELYIKTNGDPNYDPTKLQSDSRIATLLAQIDVILFTRRGEVMGHPDLGCNLEDLVYSLNYNDSQIKNEIESQLAKYVPLSMEMNVSVDV